MADDKSEADAFKAAIGAGGQSSEDADEAAAFKKSIGVGSQVAGRAAEDLSRQAEALGIGMARSTTGIAGLAGWGTKIAGKMAADITAPETETPEQTQARANQLFHFPTQEDYLNKLTRAGLYDPTFKPRNIGEAFTMGAGEALPYVAAAPVAGWGELAAYGLLPSGLAGIGSYFHVPEYITGPLSALGMGGAQRYAESIGERIAAGRAAKTAVQETSEAIAARDKYALETKSYFNKEQDRLKDWSQNKIVGLTQDKKNIALTEHQAETADAQQQRKAITDKLSTETDEQLGIEKAQDLARQWWKNDFKGIDKDGKIVGGVAKLEEDMYKVFPKDTITPLTEFQKSLTSGFKDAAQLEPLMQILRGHVRGSLASKLEQLGKSQIESGLIGQGEAPIAKFEDVRTLRTAIGELMDNPQALPGLAQQKAAEMYRALSTDMENAPGLGTAGKAALHNFNEKAKYLYDLASGPVSNLIKSPKDPVNDWKAHEVVDRMMRGTETGGQDLERLRAEGGKLGDAVDTFAGTYFNAHPDKWNGLSDHAKYGFVGADNKAAMQATFDREAASQALLDERNAAIEDWGQKMTMAGAQQRKLAGRERSEGQTILSQKAAEAQREQQRAEAAFNELRRKQSILSLTKGGVLGEAVGLGGGILGSMAVGGLTGHGTNYLNDLLPLGLAAGHMGKAAIEGMFRNPKILRNALLGSLPPTVANLPQPYDPSNPLTAQPGD